MAAGSHEWVDSKRVLGRWEHLGRDRTRCDGRLDACDWKQGSTAREAIRQATLLAPGKQPGWLTAAVAEAERGVSVQSAEASADPASEDAG